MFGFWKKEKKIIKKKYEKTDFKHLRDSANHYEKSKLNIDEITWNDLNMNDVFHNMNHTVSSAGEESLFHWLKNPLESNVELEERKAFIDRYDISDDEALDLRYALSNIDYCGFDFLHAIKMGFIDERKTLFLYFPLVILNIALLLGTYHFKTTALLGYCAMIMMTNGIIHYRFLKKKVYEMSILTYIIRMAGFLKKNLKEIERIDPKTAARLTELSSDISGITNRVGVLLKLDGIDGFADYINIAFLVKEINYATVSHQVGKYQSELIELYVLLGEIDCALAVNNYKRSLNFWSTPEFMQGGREFSVSEMYHPLLPDPVINDIDLGKSIVITGSNMSGKSTFLRTVGINIIFAQTIGISLSKRHKTDFYRLVTSISLNDDISVGKSYFLAEAEAIKRMVVFNGDQIPTVVIIDEIFKGTNPMERFAAAVEILNMLSSGNMKTLVATHDLQILPQLIGFEYHYFTENVTKDSLDFDYKIRKGIASTKNAIKILEYIRYPNEIIQKIYSRLECQDIERIQGCANSERLPPKCNSEVPS